MIISDTLAKKQENQTQQKVKREAVFVDGLWKIPLTQDYFAIVDQEDAGWLGQYLWYAHVMPSGLVYAVSKRIGIMHRAILGSLHEVLKTDHVDHIDGNSLNNSKANLRVCNHSQNQANARLRTDNTSGYKGVSFLASNNVWVASIKIRGKQTYIGRFNTPETAALAYNEAAIRLHGEFARLNVIEKGGAA